MFGFSMEEMQGRVLDRIIPERFRPAHQAELVRASRAGEKTIRERSWRWRDFDGMDGNFRSKSPQGYWLKNDEIFFMGIVRDITARKQTEMALQRREWELPQSQEELWALGARLISAQEDERRRLSCELHDDMNQRLAVLAFQIQSVQNSLPESDPMQASLQQLIDQVSSLSDDVRRLAHQLHPSILDDLGLVVALRSYIEDFSRWENLAVTFQPHNVPPALSAEIALCVYRVTQECLRNVAKHAQATHVSVRLAGSGTGLQLIIRDNGLGFTPETVRPGTHGLGLIGMKERIRGVQGTFDVNTSKGRGTTITVWIPIFLRT